ncbi:hypothetical protein GGI42DRAFT_53351 [Trichoderma sp. SZMC 28013]
MRKSQAADLHFRGGCLHLFLEIAEKDFVRVSIGETGSFLLCIGVAGTFNPVYWLCLSSCYAFPLLVTFILILIYICITSRTNDVSPRGL